MTVPSMSTTTTLSWGCQRCKSALTENRRSLLHGCISSYRRELRPLQGEGVRSGRVRLVELLMLGGLRASHFRRAKPTFQTGEQIMGPP